MKRPGFASACRLSVTFKVLNDNDDADGENIFHRCDVTHTNMTCSVTRWSDYVFNFWPFTTIRNPLTAIKN